MLQIEEFYDELCNGFVMTMGLYVFALLPGLVV